jgi:hypothetical protein
MKNAIRWTVALILVIPWTAARSFPIHVSLRAGIGVNYYAMTELDDHFTVVARDFHLEMPALSKGVDVMLQGRVWFFDLFAAAAGFEHFWGESKLEVGSISPVTYKAPANVYTVGGAVRVFTIPNVIDINAGVNGCYAKSTFGTNLLSPRRLSEYKANDWGFSLFAEAATNFLNPVEISVQMGYRRLTVSDFEDKFGDAAFFPDSSTKVTLDYSGPFFMIAAGVHL